MILQRQLFGLQLSRNASQWMYFGRKKWQGYL